MRKPSSQLSATRAISTCVVAGGLVLAACGGGGSGTADTNGDGSTNIQVGTLPLANAAPLYLGMDKGFFQDEGLKIELQVGGGGADIIPALIAGENQFGFIGVVSAIQARARGVPVTSVAISDQGAAVDSEATDVLVAPADSDITTLQDLKGKTIAVNAVGGQAELLIKGALVTESIDPSSVTLLEVPPSETLAALRQGRVDVAYAPEPFLTETLGTETIRPIDAPLVTMQPNILNGVYAASESYVQQNPEVVDSFARAMNRSVTYTQEHPQEARETIAGFTDIPQDVVQEMRIPKWSTEPDPKSVRRTADLMVRFDFIEEKPNLEKVVQPAGGGAG